jgi:hypothetical protein
MQETNLIEILQEIKETLGAISDGLYALCEVLEQSK